MRGESSHATSGLVTPRAPDESLRAGRPLLAVVPRMVAKGRHQQGAPGRTCERATTVGDHKAQPRFSGELRYLLLSKHRERVTTEQVLDPACDRRAVCIAGPDEMQLAQRRAAQSAPRITCPPNKSGSDQDAKQRDAPPTRGRRPPPRRARRVPGVESDNRGCGVACELVDPRFALAPLPDPGGACTRAIYRHRTPRQSDPEMP